MPKSLKPSTVLKKARKLIERGWCRNTLARRANGNPTDHDDPKAVRWCAFGAAARAVGTEGSWPAWSFFESAVGGCGVDFNNRQKSKRPVLAAFDKAIALALKEGQ